MKNNFITAVLIFWVLVVADIAGILLQIDPVHFMVKPLLMPALILVLIKFAGITKFTWLAGCALFFSWCGDVLLMFEYKSPLYFIGGLSAFLIAHIFYIAYFLSKRTSSQSLLVRYPALILLVIAYCTGLFFLLLPGLGVLKWPVMIYAIVIASMLLSSLHVYYKVGEPANRLLVTGAVLFVLSDSILATNKFARPVPMGGVLVMLTYCAAQYYIVCGVIKNNRSSHETIISKKVTLKN